ncbi:hypothetical protein KY335_04665 [Candidatus Woesearchaeota archaeon]|nr:hypothetical protein [Candidatus Woesearchaeota archaeon]
MRGKLYKAVDYAIEGIKPILQVGGTIFFALYIPYTLASHNGLLDSDRTKEAEEMHDESNPIKTVKTVEEKWRDHILTPYGDGFNPRVIRTVTFADGTETKLDYRVMAWQPFMKWKNGYEFNPQAGEKYEVTSGNELVKKVE